MEVTTPIQRWFTSGLDIAEKLLLLFITLATLAAIAAEVMHIVAAQQIALSDILLLFIYLEVLAMSRLYVEQGRVPVRYPIYIAIIALARYLALAMKEMPALDLLWIALSMLVLVAATVGLRIGHSWFPYDKPSPVKNLRETESDAA